MTPEAKARQTIDRRLVEAGWEVQDYKQRNIVADLGVAIREFPTKAGPADYLLYLDGKAVGVVEAKPEGHSLTGVELQSEKYTAGLSEKLPRWDNEALDRFGRRGSLPFAYESNGEETRFTNNLDPQPRSREVHTFHRPDELLRLAKLDRQLREAMTEMPDLNSDGLWPIQARAIGNLERSLAANRPRSLIQMATGSGKTFTAASACYRLVKFGEANRILFLVDRANLGRQTFREFQQYVSPYNGLTFTDEYNVQHLRGGSIAPASRVVISTIQRLYAALKGEEFDEANEERSQFENDSPLNKEPLPVVYNSSIPIETFDFIVIDECHRSIYNLWRQVLDYFDAFLIGLSATPTKQTIGFFDGNLVEEYTHEQAVRDGVNVGFDVYRVRTKITEQGAKLEAQPGFFVPRRDRRTRRRRYAELDGDVTYAGRDLDRDVVNKSQIRLVVRTFREKLPEMFPDRTEVPKTLVFAKDDSHAEDITEIIREEFGRGSEFCRKITYRTTEGKPEDLLTEFRNDFFPRIAVSVDMIATGTDVKPLECLIFLRNIKSASYFEQMKGRGCRVIDADVLRSTTTPDAKQKDRFVIVDAVGVCDEEKSHTQPLDRKPSVRFEQLLDLVASGNDHPDVASALASRLARLNKQFSEEQRADVAEAAGGKSLGDLVGGLFDAVGPDANVQRAVKQFQLPEGQEPSEKELNEVERKAVREALRPFHNPKLRETILAIKRANEQVFDEQNQDELLAAGFDRASVEQARSLIGSFRAFIAEHRDEIEAISILYSRPRQAGLTFRHVKELAKAIERPPLGVPPERLWRAYEAAEPGKVRGRWEALVDVVALVRHALDPDSPLTPIHATVEDRYKSWLAAQEKAGTAFTPEQRRWLDAIRDHIAGSLAIDTDDFDYSPFVQLGGLGRAYELFGDRLSKVLDDLNATLAA